MRLITERQDKIHTVVGALTCGSTGSESDSELRSGYTSRGLHFHTCTHTRLPAVHVASLPSESLQIAFVVARVSVEHSVEN
jgi:hypothetical protein